MKFRKLNFNKIIRSFWTWISIFILSMAGITGYYLIHKDNNKNQNQKQTQTLNFNHLPASADVEKYPLMHDFLIYQFGRHWEKNIDDYFNYYVIAVPKKYLDKKDGYAYVQKYDSVGYFPALGSKTKELNYVGAQWTGFKNGLKDLESFEEGDYIFYISSDIKRGGSTYNTIGSEDLSVLKFEQFWTQDKIAKEGYPSDWLRREPFKSRMKSYYGIDMSDPFWDKFNYLQSFTLKKIAKSDNYKDAPEKVTVQVTGTDRFLTSDFKFSFTKDQLVNSYKNYGYDMTPVEEQAK